MSDNFMEAIENSFNEPNSLDEVLGAEAVAEAAVVKQPTPGKQKKSKKTDAAAPAAPAAKAPKQPEGPNPWGIHNDRGEVITAAYLRKYFQCSTRGETYELNRAANMAYFMSDAFLQQHAGKSAGEVSRLVAADDRWFDEKHPRPEKKPRQAKKAAAPAAPAADTTAAVEAEAALLDALVSGDQADNTTINFA